MTFSSLAFITGRLYNEEREVEHTWSARSPGRNPSTPHVCPSGQALGMALILTWGGVLAGVQRCSPLLIAQSGWQMGSRLAFVCALPSSHLYQTRRILTG